MKWRIGAAVLAVLAATATVPLCAILLQKLVQKQNKTQEDVVILDRSK